MRYVIFGAGAVGGSIGAFMTKANKDVTLIARGETLREIEQNGLTVSKESGSFTVKPKICSEAEYSEKPDVIFVCVKGYSIDSVVPFINRVAATDTIVIPILNIYGTGEALQKKAEACLVTDGCVYIAAGSLNRHTIKMHGDIFRIVFGVRNKKDYSEKLEKIKSDLDDCGINGIISDNMKRDAMMKFSYVSAQASCGLYYGVTAGAMQKPGEIRDCFISLVSEIALLSSKMGITFEEDIVKRNLKILDDLAPTSSTSMQRDIENGKKSEIDGLLFSVVRSAESFGITLPTYKKIAEFAEKNNLHG